MASTRGRYLGLVVLLMCAGLAATIIALVMAYTLTRPAAAEPAAPKPVYKVTPLGTLGGSQSIARDINDAGQVTGQSQNTLNQNRGFLWQDDGQKMKPIGTLGGNTSPARGINKFGQVVGFSRISTSNMNTQLRGYLAQNGSLTRLETLTYLSDSGTPTTYSNSEAWSINDSEMAVGRSFNNSPQGEPTTNGRAVLWAKGQTSNPKDLREYLKPTYEDPTSSGSETAYSEAWRINNLDQVVGEVGVADQQAKAFLYDNNTKKVTDIHAAGRQDPANPVFPYEYSEAMGINDHGQVVGWSYRTTDPDPEGEAFLYEQDTARAVPLYPLEGHTYSRARDIDESGRIVGWSRGTIGNGREQFSATIWEDGEVTDLNDLIPADSRWRRTGDNKIEGWKLVDAYAINESGQIVGSGYKDGNELPNQIQAFLLTPDTTAPKIECDTADDLWHKEDVSIPCTASDDGVGLADPTTDAGFTLSTRVPAETETSDAVTDSRQVCDAAGNCATAGPIGGNKVDKKTPSFFCPAADGDWHASDVSLNCTANDGGSGLDPSSDSNFTLSTNVAAGTETNNASTGTKTLTDAVGNTVTAPAIPGNKVDKKVPSTNASTGTYNGRWTNQSVTVTLNASDGGSGVQKTEYSIDGGAFQAYTSAFSVGNDGDHTILYRSTDNANNQESNKSLTVKVDKTAPVVNCGSADGKWHASDVIMACTANDGGSELADSNDASFSLSTSVAAGSETSSASTNSRDVYDNAGNFATAGPISGNKVDKKVPVISITVSPSGGEYELGEDVTVGYDCSDSGSGTASCSGPVDSGGKLDTASVGQHTFTVEASDRVGNVGSQPFVYQVIYDFGGFFGPVDNPDVATNKAKAGSSIPVMFSLGGDQGVDIFATGTNPTTNEIFTYPTSTAMTCDSTDQLDAIEETVTAGRNSLQYDSSLDQYTYVWKTEKAWAGSCRQLVVNLDDGTYHRANFKFVK